MRLIIEQLKPMVPLCIVVCIISLWVFIPVTAQAQCAKGDCNEKTYVTIEKLPWDLNECREISNKYMGEVERFGINTRANQKNETWMDYNWEGLKEPEHIEWLTLGNHQSLINHRGTMLMYDLEWLDHFFGSAQDMTDAISNFNSELVGWEFRHPTVAELWLISPAQYTNVTYMPWPERYKRLWNGALKHKFIATCDKWNGKWLAYDMVTGGILTWEQAKENGHVMYTLPVSWNNKP